MTGPELRHQFFEPADLVAAYLPHFNGGGFFIPAANPLDLWTEFSFEFNLPPEEDLVRARAEVLWVNRPGGNLRPGMGFRIKEMEAEDRERLETYLQKWACRDDLFGGKYYRIFPSGPSGQSELPGEEESVASGDTNLLSKK